MREPLWRAAKTYPRFFFDEKARSWMLYRQSMTQRMREICAKQMRIEVVLEKWTNPLSSEAVWLGIEQHESILLRVVRMYCDEKLSLLGRSVFLRDIRCSQAGYRLHLDKRPIGETLFADPFTQRSAFEWSRVSSAQMKSLWCTALSQPAWARRSLFHYQGLAFLLSEVLLPDLLDL